MTEKINAVYGVALRSDDSLFGYYGWPSITRMPNGRLLVAASGRRMSHICPFGKSIVAVSEDEGKTWSLPMLANETPLDDRDTGLTTLPDGRIALMWFTNTVAFQRGNAAQPWWGEKRSAFINAYLDLVTEEDEKNNLGSFIRYSADNAQSFGEKVRVPFTAPHGITYLSDGTLFCLGKVYDGIYDENSEYPEEKVIAAYTSKDGIVWNRIGQVPIPDGFICDNFHEPHSIELRNGDIFGLIRVQGHEKYPFNTFSTVSKDKGITWSEPVPTTMTGSPPHIIRHSSGKLVCVYAQRDGKNSCEKAAVSDDEGKTWKDYVLDDRPEDWDLGYPCSVELKNGNILTVYYQKLPGGSKNSILTAEWSLQ